MTLGRSIHELEVAALLISVFSESSLEGEEELASGGSPGSRRRCGVERAPPMTSEFMGLNCREGFESTGEFDGRSKGAGGREDHRLSVAHGG